MCPVTAVSFQLMILQEKRLQAVLPGPRGTEGQAGSTVQVRVLGIPAAPSAAPCPGDSTAGMGACTQCCVQQGCRHLTLCPHPKLSHSRGCCCHPQPQARQEQQPSPAQECSLTVPLISSCRHTEGGRERAQGLQLFLHGVKSRSPAPAWA